MRVKWLAVLMLGAVLGGMGGCEGALKSIEAPNTSAMYDMAADPGRPFSDRRAAAMLMGGYEMSALRELLMKRIPNGWYSTAAGDMLLLSTIGDEGTAQYLEELYTQVPDGREDAASMTAQLHTAVARIRNRMEASALEIAMDRLVSREQRLVAVKRLDGTERVQLQVILLARIPGKWDGNLGNDIQLLGQIGDAQAAAKLEGIYQQPDFVDVGGDLTTALVAAVRQIRERTGQM